MVGVQFGTTPTVTFRDSTTTVPAVLKSSTGDQARVIVPRVSSGRVQVQVSTDQGISDPLSFTVLQPPPVLTSFTPANGVPGTVVTLTGDYLNSVRTVRFGTTPVTSLTAVSAQQLLVVVPTGLARGLSQLTVETPTGLQSGDFVVAATPQITDFSPKRTRIGAALAIQGRNLADATVRVGGQPTDRSQTITTDTEIRTIVPPNAVAGRITVTVFDRLTTTSTDSLKLAPSPVITAQSATEGIRGDKVTLTGQNFSDINSVSVGTVAAVFRLLSDVQLELTIPDQSQSVSAPITISGVGGSSTSPQPFLTYLAPANLTVDLARQIRGKDITIRGQNLFRISEVRIGGRLATINSRTEGAEVRTTVSADALTGAVTVTNRAGTGQPAQNLTVVQKVTVTDYTPKRAKVGDRLTVTGSFLLNAQFVFANSTIAAPVEQATDAQIVVRVPTDAATGPIRLSNETGEVISTDVFTLLKLPVILDFTPKASKVGTEVVISGQNLADVTDVRFGTGKSSAAKITLKTATSISVLVPTDATDGPICISNEAGGVCSIVSFILVK